MDSRSKCKLLNYKFKDITIIQTIFGLIVKQNTPHKRFIVLQWKYIVKLKFAYIQIYKVERSVLGVWDPRFPKAMWSQVIRLFDESWKLESKHIPLDSKW